MDERLARARAIREERRAQRQSRRQQPSSNVIACRVDDEVLEALDVLIEAGVFATRSEAAGAMIKGGLERNRALIAEVSGTVSEIRRLREDLAGKARRVMGANAITQVAAGGDAAVARPGDGAE